MSVQDYDRVLEAHNKSIQELRLNDERIKGRVDAVEGRVDSLHEEIQQFRTEIVQAHKSTRGVVDQVCYDQALALGATRNIEKWLKFGVPLAALLLAGIELYMRFG